MPACLHLGKRARLLLGADDVARRALHPAEDSLDLRMPRLADDDHGQARLRCLLDAPVNPRNERTRRVHDREPARAQRLVHGLRLPVGADDDRVPLDLLQGLRNDCAPRPHGLHDRRVVDDRAQGGRPTALIQQGVHRVDRAPDAKAEARMAGKRNLHADPPIAVAQSSCYNSMSYTKILLFSRKTLDLM